MRPIAAILYSVICLMAIVLIVSAYGGDGKPVTAWIGCTRVVGIGVRGGDVFASLASILPNRATVPLMGDPTEALGHRPGVSLVGFGYEVADWTAGPFAFAHSGPDVPTNPTHLPPLNCARASVVRVAVPLWLIALVAAAIPVVWFGREIRLELQRPHTPGSCPGCGYDLRATPEQCPECGTTPG